MLLDRMIAAKPQLQGIARLDRVIASGDLRGNLHAFLLYGACLKQGIP